MDEDNNPSEESNVDVILPYVEIPLAPATDNYESEEPPPKFRKTAESPKYDLNKSVDGEDCCSICFDGFTQTGAHKIASLKCGHLFGYKCIMQWLKPHDCRSCPTCKAQAHSRDVRLIYAKRLVAADNTELNEMTVKYEQERSRCLKLELDLSKSKLINTTLMYEIAGLRETMGELKRRISEKDKTYDSESGPSSWRLALEKNVEICTDSSCRVIAHDPDRRVLYVTKHTQNALFPGFGVKDLNYETYSTGPSLQLHPKEIRDLSYSRRQEFLLTASLDKTAKVVSASNSRVALTFTCDMPLWSCTWDNDCADRFYVGGIGVVQQYDIRQPRTCLNRMTQPSDISPVASLASTPYGLLVCQLNSCWLKKQSGSDLRDYCMSTDGPFVSMTFEPNTDRFLLSSRPGQLHSRSRHRVCRFEFDLDSCASAVESTFEGSTVQTLMSRSCQLFVGTDSLISAYSEKDSAVIIYSSEQKRQLQTLPSQDYVKDITSITSESHRLLATLSGNRVRIYKAIPFT